MPSKGVTKTGDAFCMSCGATVDPDAIRCESCYSQLDSEVKAFGCPRCGKVLELGTNQCPRCSMRFMVKTIRQSDGAEDDEMLTRLIDWGRGQRSQQPAEEAEAAHPPEGLTDEEAEAISALLTELSDLADLRAEVASGMGTRLSDARQRISRLKGSPPSEIPVEDLESEFRAISDDLSRIAEVFSRTKALSDEVSRTFSMPGPVSLTGGRGLSISVPQQVDAGQSSSEKEIADREEQVRKREEMVDRKIAAYALKKKQLESLEAKLEGHQPAGSPPPPEDASGELKARIEDLSRKTREVHEVISDEGACDDAEPCLDSLERHVRALVDARSALEQEAAQLREGEDETRSLLKILDNLLGQLPPETIDRFSNSEEFKLYERVLDRLKI